LRKKQEGEPQHVNDVLTCGYLILAEYAATDRTHCDKMARSFLASVKIKAQSINHGRRCEPIAIQMYEKAKDVATQECGIFVCEERVLEALQIVL